MCCLKPDHANDLAYYRQGGVGLLIMLFIVALIPLAPVHAQSTIQTIESDDPRVLQAGTWSSQAASATSNGSYLYSSGDEADVLGLAFLGSAIEIIYVAGPQFGTLAIEVDGTVVRTVITTSEKITYAQAARVDYLSDEPHTVKVYAQAGGIIAVDAFVIIPTSPLVSLSTTVEGEQDGGIQSTPCAPLSVTHRVSLNHLGAESTGLSASPSISGDGRYVAFESNGALVPVDGGPFSDVYVYDRQTCTIQLVSVSALGGLGTGSSYNAVISSNGRYVAYESIATNLVAGDTNGNPDVFVYDRQTGNTTRASVDSGFGQATGGPSINPVISADGRYIAFHSAATNLVGSDTNSNDDVFVRDTQSAQTFRVSISNEEAQAIGGPSRDPSISADGRYIAFRSMATNLVAGDTNAAPDIFVRDIVSNTTTRVSVSNAGAQAAGVSGSSGAAISGDGRYITFESFATNLVADDTNGFPDVFVRDIVSNTTTRVSISNAGAQATGEQSIRPAISANGRYIAFETQATNLVAGDTNSLPDVFVRDIVSNTTTRVSVSSTGAQATGASGGALQSAISADGRFITFGSTATNLVAGDTNDNSDVFISPRVLVAADTLALFNPPVNYVGLLSTLQDNPPISAYTAFSAYAMVGNGQWVMGDWNGDGLDTPGVYANGPFFYTNKTGESQPSNWRSLWIGVPGIPVSGRFNGALANDCIGAVQTASLGGQTVFVFYFTCQLDGTPAPAISSQWLSAVLPDSGGFSGVHQFSAGDFNGDRVDSIAVRRGTFIAFGNIAPATGPATFNLAQFIGTPQTGADAGIFVVGNWDNDPFDSFGLFYQNGEFFYRNDLIFNSGVYVNQSVGTPFGSAGVQVTTWR